MSLYDTPIPKCRTSGQVSRRVQGGCSGQSLGKRITKIQIIDRDENPVVLSCDLFLRELFFIIPASVLTTAIALKRSSTFYWQLAVLFLILDMLPMFFKDRRCIHDYIAGTQVCDIKPGLEQQTGLIGYPDEPRGL